MWREEANLWVDAEICYENFLDNTAKGRAHISDSHCTTHSTLRIINW